MHVSYVSISAAHFLKTTSATLDWAGIILLQLLLLQVEAILQRTYVRTRTAENSCQWPIKYNYVTLAVLLRKKNAEKLLPT